MKIGDMVRMKGCGTPTWHGGVHGIYIGPADEDEWGPDYHIFMYEGKFCWTDCDYIKNKLEIVNHSCADDELSDKQLDNVCGGMSSHVFGTWRSRVINESR